MPDPRRPRTEAFLLYKMVTNSATMRDPDLPRHIEHGIEQAGQPAQAAGQAQLGVAIISDLLEEQWPSMDLVADMLAQSLEREPSFGIQAAQMRPPMRRRLTRLPLVGAQRSLLNADRLCNRFFDYPRWLSQRTNQFDVFHLVDHSYSQLMEVLPEERSVITCHDLDTFRCLLEPERESRPRWFRAMAQRILNGFRRAAHVIAVSQATKDELLRNGLFESERISVIPNGVHPACSPSPNTAADIIATGWMPDNDRAWLLSVGNTLPRKRLDVLLRAFARIHREMPEARLVRVGGFTPALMDLIQELKLASAIVMLPALDRDVLAAVYRRASLLLHTADAEGFGLPVIEAMACGCPVVASDLPVLREVGGPAACFCRVADLSAWEQTLLRLLEERRQHPDDWEQRRQHGIQWAARFSWRENACRTACIYRKVIENTK